MLNFRQSERISPAQKAAQKGYPTTRYPIPVKKNLDLMVAWKSENGHLGYSLGSKQHAHGDCLVLIQDILVNAFLTEKYRVPPEAVSVSLAFENFQVGKSYHEFFPRDKELPPDSFFSYRMFSKHVQATYYNENGNEFLAGICYFPQLKHSVDIDTLIDYSAFVNAQWLTNEYPLVNRGLTRAWIQRKRYSRFCKTRNEKAMLCVDEETGKAVHYQYDFLRREKEFVSCPECEQELMDYKFEHKKVSSTATTELSDVENVLESLEIMNSEPSNSEDEFDFVEDLNNQN